MVSLDLLTAFLYLLSLTTLVSVSTYSNPIRNPEGSDPFIVYTGGYYYLLRTTWTDVSISRATMLNSLKSATQKVVYSTTTASRCCYVWSPECITSMAEKMLWNSDGTPLFTPPAALGTVLTRPSGE
jgi:hypothetical protein